jgi:hypothetical protein
MRATDIEKWSTVRLLNPQNELLNHAEVLFRLGIGIGKDLTIVDFRRTPIPRSILLRMLY